MEELVDSMCIKLRNSLLTVDLERLDRARDLLTKLQSKEIFERILGPDDDEGQNDFDADDGSALVDLNPTSEVDGLLGDDMPEAVEEEELPCPFEPDVDLPEDSWHGYFRGYEILNETAELSISENKMCIEITKNSCNEDLGSFLRSGVRCFVIDLFTGTATENQQLVVRLRENEFKVSKEFGFPVSATLFAKLSPRLQYTGELDAELVSDHPNSKNHFVLAKDEELTVTTQRVHSMRCSKRRIYVNARFLLTDLKPCDFICIGPDIQLRVNRIKNDRLRCTVVEGGVLQSRMPVLFPGRCSKFRVSMEELEDITFAKEVGINVIVSHIVGTQEYFDNLVDVLKLFNCGQMRLCARVLLNELKGCEKDYNWAADVYDGFLVELTPHEANQSEILSLCPAAEELLKRAFDLKKPIVFDPTPLADNRFVVEPRNFIHVYYYPDKYLFKCTHMHNSFRFLCLQDALFTPIANETLAKLPHCDASHTGSDSLALSAVAAAFEMRASVIFVLGITGRMAIKLSHFRPKTPIVFITNMKSAADFVCLHHNVYLLFYSNRQRPEEHTTSVYRHLLYGLAYGKSRRLVRHQDNVIFVYGKEPGTKFPDKYISYKFDEKHFAEHMSKLVYE